MSKRAEILTATRKLFWTHGYESTSPRMIMDESGAGQGSLYHHFPDKKQLALATLTDIELQLSTELSNTLGDMTRPPLERIQAWLALPRQALRGCRLGRLAFEHSLISDEELRAPLARYFSGLQARLHSTLQEAIEAGDLPTHLEAAPLAALIVGAVQGGYLLSRVHQDPLQLQQATQGAWLLLEQAARHPTLEDPSKASGPSL